MIIDRDAYARKIKKLDADRLTKLRADLIIKTERARVRFARTRSCRDGDIYGRAREQLGMVRTQLTLCVGA